MTSLASFVLALATTVVLPAHANCDFLAAGRLGELERLANPRPEILGETRSPRQTLENIFPSQPLRVRTVTRSHGLLTPIEGREMIQFSIETSGMYRCESYVRLTRQSRSPQKIDFACKVSAHPLVLAVKRLEEGYQAEITALEGNVLWIEKIQNARLRLVLRFDARAELTGITYTREDLNNLDNVLRIEMTPDSIADF